MDSVSPDRTSRRIRPVIGCVLLTTGVAVITPGAWFLVLAQRVYRDFDHAMVTPLARVPIDLSKESESVREFDVSYPSGHGLRFVVESTDEMLAPKLETLLKGTEGEIEIAGAGYSQEHAFHDLDNWQPEYAQLCATDWSDPGRYRVRIVVTQGNAELPSIGTELVIKNKLCGCELLAGWWLRALAAVAGLIGVPFALSGVWFVWPRRRLA